MIQQVDQYRPSYAHPPTPDLVRAANELKNFSPNFELSQLTEQGVFDLAWRALEKFCRVEVNDYIHPQSEEEKAAIFAGVELPRDTESEIIGKFDDIYRAAIDGITLILSRSRPVEVSNQTVTHFGAALHEQIGQVLPGTDEGFIREQLIHESMAAENDNARMVTRAVVTDTTRQRMWHILSSVDEFAKYKKYSTSPAELEARFAATGEAEPR